MPSVSGVKCVLLLVLSEPFIINVETNIVSKCDLCGGDPACVKLCPSGAITYQEANVGSLTKRRAFAARFKDVFEEVG